MKRTTPVERAQAWVVDYSAARTHAIRWLGDRYLLAAPINAREAARRKRLSAIWDSPPADGAPTGE